MDDLEDQLAPDLTMDSTEEDINRRMQVRASLAALLEKQRLAAVEGPVRLVRRMSTLQALGCSDT